MKPFTPKLAAFVREYLVDLNATKAAERAGYSAKTAYSAGQRLLKNVEIQKAIQAAISKRAENVDITAEKVLVRLWEEGNLKADGASHAARVSALKLVGLHVGLKFTERHEFGGLGGGPIQLETPLDLSKLATDELLKLAELVTKAQATIKPEGAGAAADA